LRVNASEEPLVSVLTPVYNGERYLAECIESVLAQSYRNWEYIINNNCSTDRTLEIAERYARQDSRIRIYQNDRLVRAVENHNGALSRISPESTYCKFIQADDWLFPECLARMVEVAVAHPTIGLVSSYRLVDREVGCDGLPYPSTFMPGREMGRRALLDRVDVFGSPSTVMFRSDLVRGTDAFFNEAHVYADTEACYKVLQSSDFGFVHQVLSYSRRHAEQVGSFVSRFETWTLARLHFINEFGLAFMTPEERQLHLEKALDSYYRIQGKNLFRLKGKAYWSFHRKGLAELGFTYRWSRVLKGAFLEIVRVLTQPLQIIGRRLRDLVVTRKQEE
jgi:glycosyltransferase involved in cell wall biosynthesis